MPLPLCVLPGILGAGERVAPGEGAENWRDGRMISAPTNYRDPAPGGRTLCAPTEGRGTGTGADCCHPAAVCLPGPPPFCRGGYQPPAGARCAPLRKTGKRTGGRNIGPHEKPARVRPPGGTSNRGAKMRGPNGSPAKRLSLGEDEQRKERALPHRARRAIWSLRGRDWPFQGEGISKGRGKSKSLSPLTVLW